MKPRPRWIFLASLVALSLLGMLALWRSTPYGLGLVNDSATYVEGSARILEGQGFVRISGGGEIKPITHFPPLFSLLLAGLGLAGMDIVSGARLLITLLFGMDILLVGLSVYKISHSMVFACLGALLLAVSDVHLGVYSFLLSEPLFLTLMLAAFLCLAESFDRTSWVWPVLAGLLLSLAYLTRYAGASLFLTALLVILLLRPSRIFRRIGWMLAGAAPPLLAWLGYSLSVSGVSAVGNRQLAWHPVPLDTLFNALKNLLTWMAPNDLLNAGSLWGRLLSLISILILPGLAAGLAWAIIQRSRPINHSAESGSGYALAVTQSMHVLVYLSFVVVSLTFFDASTPLNDRILSVVYLPEIILFASGVCWLWYHFTSRAKAIRWVLAAFCIILAMFSIKDGYAAVLQIGREGQGFAYRGISGSQAIQSIQQMPSTIIYSNKPGAIFLLTGKTAYVTPTPDDPVTLQARGSYTDNLAQMHQAVREGKAILVLFGLRNSIDPAEVSMFADLTAGLRLQADYGEIVIYGGSP